MFQHLVKIILAQNYIWLEPDGFKQFPNFAHATRYHIR